MNREWFQGPRHRVGSQIGLTLKVETAVSFDLWTSTYQIIPTLRYIPYSEYTFPSSDLRDSIHSLLPSV